MIALPRTLADAFPEEGHDKLRDLARQRVHANHPYVAEGGTFDRMCEAYLLGLADARERIDAHGRLVTGR